MVKIETGVYIDEEGTWELPKGRAAKIGVEISKLPEEVLDEAMLEMAGGIDL